MLSRLPAARLRVEPGTGCWMSLLLSYEFFSLSPFRCLSSPSGVEIAQPVGNLQDTLNSLSACVQVMPYSSNTRGIMR